MDKHIWWAVAIDNCVNIICWTLLAIHFDKWWIALFAALFMTYVKRRDSDEQRG